VEVARCANRLSVFRYRLGVGGVPPGRIIEIFGPEAPVKQL
jgi:hypothetical protein